MIKLLINLLIIFLLISCQLQKDNKIIKLIEDKKSFTKNTTISKKNTTILEKNTIVSEKKNSVWDQMSTTQPLRRVCMPRPP